MMNQFISCLSCLEEQLYTYSTKAVQEKLVSELFSLGRTRLWAWQLTASKLGDTHGADEAAVASASFIQQAMEDQWQWGCLITLKVSSSSRDVSAFCVTFFCIGKSLNFAFKGKRNREILFLNTNVTTCTAAVNQKTRACVQGCRILPSVKGREVFVHKCAHVFERTQVAPKHAIVFSNILHNKAYQFIFLTNQCLSS